MLLPGARYTSATSISLAEGWSLERLTPPSRLFGANGLRTGPDGRIYVAQVAGSQVSALDVETGALETISAQGSDIIAPDVAFDPRGNLYATEYYDGRVSVRSGDGRTRVIWNQNFGHLGTGLPYAIGASVADGGKRPLMLITGDSSFLFHIAELETAGRLNLPLVCVVGVDYAWGLEVGVYKRTFGQGSLETGVHWSKNTRLDKVAEGFGCYGEYVDRDEDIAPAIKRAYASGRTGVIHVTVDPKANSEEMPQYSEFRTWYAEGMQ